MAKSGLKSVTAKAEFQLYKVKFSNGEAKRKELLGQLQEYNDKLEKLLSTSDRDAQLKKQRTAVQYKTSIDATLCSFWKQASKLFHALASAWNCTCAKDQHLAKLLLQHRTTKKAEFDIMFSSRGASGWQIQHTRISEDDDGDFQMTTTKGATPTANASVTATLPVRQPGHRQNSAGIKLKSAMRTATKSKLAATAGGQNQVMWVLFHLPLSLQVLMKIFYIQANIFPDRNHLSRLAQSKYLPPSAHHPRQPLPHLRSRSPSALNPSSPYVSPSSNQFSPRVPTQEDQPATAT